MASKRSADNSGDAPPSKKSFALSEPINIGPVSTEEELDSAVLKIQNKKLWARLEEKNAAEEEMKNRYTKLERARENDRSIISYMNQAWNQMDEDVELMLKRFQAEDQSHRIGETTVAFLEKLSNRTTKGVKEEMEKRKQNSIQVVKKLTLLIDRVVQRKDDMTKALHNFKESSRTSSTSSQDEEENDGTFDISSVELAIRQENASLKAENKNLHDLQTSLHDKYASMSSEFTDLKDKLASSQKECSELTTKQQDMEYDLQKATKQFEKLIKKLNETQSTAAPSTSQPTASQSSSSSTAGKIGVTPAQDNEQCNELAKSRLIELEKLQKNHQKLVEEHQKLQQQLQNIPEETIVNTPKYKMLQIQFNMLFADAQIIRKSCEDARKIIINSRSQHLQQLDLLEVENEKMKKAIRAEFSSMEKQLTDTRKELELLRIEYNHNMRANEQVAPMAKEMRHLINNLQNKNQQLKNDVQRSKQKITDLQKKNEELERNKPSKVEESTEDYIDRIEAPPVSSPPSDASQSDNEASDCGDLKVLRTKLKSAREKRKDMKLLLDMYKNVSKETRDKAELLKNEKMLKEKLETVKYKLQVVTEDTVKQARRFAIHDHEKEFRRLHNQIEELHKFVSNTKQEEEALMSEMEFTGQAFDEMKEQNIRLMQQLREKDDTNLKLMSERIKSNQIQKLLREEKELLSERLKTSANRMTAHEEVTKRLEEREKVLQTAVTNFEKEITLRNQAAECHKRKAMDLGEKLQETSLKLDHTNKLLEESKGCVGEKTNQLEEELFKNNRVQEENEKFKKKLKRMEYMGASDEILVEEVKMYKSKLTCPCCNTNRKDAILTKCFHVFCFECLKTRYDTRQRKCPKCNATFGNNDFHKIYM